MEENQNPPPPVSETPPVIPGSPPPVILSEAKDPNQSSPIKPASKFSTKAIIGTLIFLLLAGGAAAGYIYKEPILKLVSKPSPTPTVVPASPTPTPDPTADWKTYQGDGFSFKYPSTWKHIKCEGSSNININPTDFSCETDGGFAIVILQSNSLENPFIEFKKEGMVKEEKQLIVDNQKVNQARVRSDPFEYTDTWINVNDKYIDFILYDDEQKSIYDQILSTFKFTDEQTDTSNWKTYNNSEYLYSVKYPKDWDIGVKGDANPETFPAPYFSSPCEYQKSTLCSQIFIEASLSKDKNDLEPDFIIDSPGDKIYNKSLILVDGEKASEFNWFESNYYSDSNNNGRLMHVVVTQKNGFKYAITYQESQKNQQFRNPKDWKAKQSFDQFISTFKFTE